MRISGKHCSHSISVTNTNKYQYTENPTTTTTKDCVRELERSSDNLKQTNCVSVEQCNRLADLSKILLRCSTQCKIYHRQMLICRMDGTWLKISMAKFIISIMSTRKLPGLIPETGLSSISILLLVSLFIHSV